MPETLRLGQHDSLEILSSTPEAFEIEATYSPGGSPPPAHHHPSQDEHFEVLAGAMRARVDGEEIELPEGGELDISRGQVHQMWNPGGKPARVRWLTTPALRTEEWFRALDGLFGEVAAGREVDLGTLLAEYADVFELDP
jgi:quercetin dioxygenase-like cupin family protein